MSIVRRGSTFSPCGSGRDATGPGRRAAAGTTAVVALLGALVLVSGACGSAVYTRNIDGGDDLTPGESGGATGSGGQGVGTGGGPGTGGVLGTGGAVGTGGSPGTGGGPGTGGSATGGSAASGGRGGSGAATGGAGPGTGGAANSTGGAGQGGGGAASGGATPATGGAAPGTGGGPGSGGAATGGAATGGAGTGGAGGAATGGAATGGAATGGAATGGAATGGAATGGAATDGARYNFETSTQAWTMAAGTTAFTTIARDTTQHFAGVASLSATITATAAHTYQLIVSPSPAIPAGATVTFRVLVPISASTTMAWIQPYVQEGVTSMPTPYLWTGTFTPAASIAFGVWTTIQVQVPAVATPIVSLGVQFSVSAPWTGTVYVDSVNW